MKLIAQLNTKRLLDSWIGILDWLLDGNHFSKDRGWDKNKVTQFTKKVKRLPYLSSKENWIVDANKRQNWNADDGSIYVRMNSDSSEGRSLIRHIRNSIAHGNCEISGSNDELTVRMRDFNTNNQQQTCSIVLPIEHIERIYEIYQEIENNPNSGKKRRKSA